MPDGHLFAITYVRLATEVRALRRQAASRPTYMFLLSVTPESEWLTRRACIECIQWNAGRWYGKKKEQRREYILSILSCQGSLP